MVCGRSAKGVALALLFGVHTYAVRVAELDFASAAPANGDAAAALAGDDVEDDEESPEPSALLDTSLEKKGRTVHRVRRCRVRVRRWPFDRTGREFAERVRMNSRDIAQFRGESARNAGNIVRNAQNINQLSGAVSNNAQNIAANRHYIGLVGRAVSENTAAIAANANAISAVGSVAAQNSAAIQGLASSVSMLSGSVAANSAAIGQLTAQVAVLNQAAAPTVALASTLGLSVGTVSTMALAGSFATPVLGCIMLVYACWPDEKNDPWWNIESRVSKMINDRFNEERQKRLNNRLKRYIKEFTTCATTWIEHATSRNPSLLQLQANHMSGHQYASLFQAAMQNVTGRGLDELDEVDETDDNWELNGTSSSSDAVPACMEQLNMHMSLERDEWMGTQGNSLSGLFMPFANLHTQVQALLTDYPSMTHAASNWDTIAKATAGEYAHFMLTHLLDAWKGQMCRSVRLRYSPSTTRKYWQYQLTVLSPIWQPHAGEDCFEKCGHKSGWCNYCGGRKVGACCKKGAAQMNPPQDPSECLQFDPPAGKVGALWGYSKETYHACMHTDCEQRNLYYKGTTLYSVPNVTTWTECHSHCLSFERSLAEHTQIAASWHPYGMECKCRSGALTRVYKEGAVSAFVPCPDKKEESDGPTEEAKAATPKVPMEELRPCEGSEWVKTLDDLQASRSPWTQQCYQNASKLVATQYNSFHSRFAKFVDQLAWRAGCGGHPDLSLNEDFDAISANSSFGSFGECDWEREKQRGKDPEWVPDEDRREGWLGHSRINMDEQAQLRAKYPLPEWLESRRSMLDCLSRAAHSGASEDPDHPGATQEHEMVNAIHWSE